jgi:hypothetical protein
MAANPLDAAIASLTARVNAATTVEDSATIYINSVPGLIAAAVAQAQAAGATPAQLKAITDLGAALDTASAPLQAALTANTPQG